jgi:hypothetical protein
LLKFVGGEFIGPTISPDIPADVSCDQLREELINVCSRRFSEPSELLGGEEMAIFDLLI